MITMFIVQYSKPNGDGEYLVLLDEKPTKTDIEAFRRPGFDRDALYEAEVRSLTPRYTPNALPTERELEVQ